MANTFARLVQICKYKTLYFNKMKSLDFHVLQKIAFYGMRGFQKCIICHIYTAIELCKLLYL